MEIGFLLIAAAIYFGLKNIAGAISRLNITVAVPAMIVPTLQRGNAGRDALRPERPDYAG